MTAAQARAAIRYAAPGGNNEPGSECLQAHLCSLFNAASVFASGTTLTEGDEVIVEPGNYSGIGDLGSGEGITLEGDTNVHGVAGCSERRTRPLGLILPG